MSADEVAIRLDSVTKVFPGATTAAVTSLDLEIPAGRLVVFVGPSGCGKTTTLKMINRLIDPTSGTISVLGNNILELPKHELRRQIGYVIQQIGLFPHRTIEANIGTVPKLLGWPKRRIRERVAELVSLVGLDPEMMRRYPSELSGGQQQRVGVARALAADPPILLMDEPYSAVDPVVRARLQSELLELQRRLNKTTVLVTHDIDEAILLGDEVVLFETGGIVAQQCTPAELLAAPASPFVEEFLGKERGLRRLSLMTPSDIEISLDWTVQANATAAEALGVIQDQKLDWVAVADGDQLCGWVWEDEIRGLDRMGDATMHSFRAVVDLNTTLRATLDEIVNSKTRVAVVIDDGRYLGMVTVAAISEGIA